MTVVSSTASQEFENWRALVSHIRLSSVSALRRAIKRTRPRGSNSSGDPDDFGGSDGHGPMAANSKSALYSEDWPAIVYVQKMKKCSPDSMNK